MALTFRSLKASRSTSTEQEILNQIAVLIEFLSRNRFGYPWALTLFEVIVIVLLLFIFGFGPEQRGRSFPRRES